MANTNVYFPQGGDSMEVASGGSVNLASGSEITVASGAKIAGPGPVVVTDGTTYTVLAANSGRTHVMPNLTADCAVALPTAAAGLEYTFVYGGVAADAQDWNISTGSDTNFYLGGLLEVNETGPAASAANPDGNSNSIVNVLTPDVGTRIYLECDGTNWYLSGTVASASAPTFADQ